MGEELELGINKKVAGNKWKWTHHSQKPIRHSKGIPEREVHNYTGLPKKKRIISNKKPNTTPTRTWGTTTKTTQSKYKEGNNQDQTGIKWHRLNAQL